MQCFHLAGEWYEIKGKHSEASGSFCAEPCRRAGSRERVWTAWGWSPISNKQLGVTVLFQFYDTVRYFLQENADQEACCWRNLFSCINLVRILQKLTKWKHSRTMVNETSFVAFCSSCFCSLVLVFFRLLALGQLWAEGNELTLLRICNCDYTQTQRIHWYRGSLGFKLNILKNQ